MCSKSLVNFLFPVTFFCSFSPSSVGRQLQVVTVTTWTFLCVADSLLFLWISEHVCKHLHFYRPGTYFVRWLWIYSVSVFWEALEIFPCWGKKDSSTKERIHDGRTWEMKRISLHHSGQQGTIWSKDIERFYYGRWLPIHLISSSGQSIREVIRKRC